MAGQVKKEYGQGVISSGTEKEEDDLDLDALLAPVGVKMKEVKSTVLVNGLGLAVKKSTLNTAPTVRVNEVARREANQRREEAKQTRAVITGVGSTVLNTLGRQINARAEEIKRNSEQQFLATKMAQQQLSNLVKDTDESNQARFRALQYDVQKTMEEVVATKNEILALINELNRASEAAKGEILAKIERLQAENAQRMNELQATLGSEIRASESRVKAKVNAATAATVKEIAASEERLSAQIDGVLKKMDEYNRETLAVLERDRQERQREREETERRFRAAQAAQAAAQAAKDAAAEEAAAQQAAALQQALQRLRQQDYDNEPVTVYSCASCGGANDNHSGCDAMRNVANTRLLPITLTRAQAASLGAQLAPDGSTFRIQVAPRVFDVYGRDISAIAWRNNPDKEGAVRKFLQDRGITRQVDGSAI